MVRAFIWSTAKSTPCDVRSPKFNVACVMSYARMSAVAETLEIMGNPEAMRAIRAHKAGKTKFGRLDDIPE